MTELLKQAFAEVSNLPPAEQNAFAARILHFGKCPRNVLQIRA